MSELNSIQDAIADIKAGKMVVVIDHENRENEGDLIMAGEKVTPEAINFMATYGRGLICCPVSEEIAAQKNFHPMVQENLDRYTTNFTVSVDLRQGTTTGISAKERAITIQGIADPTTTPQDFLRPGHIFPLIAKSGGVLKRPGHTEASIDLALLAGLKPVGVICEILQENGEMARLPELLKFKEKFDLKIISIDQLIAFQKSTKE